MEEEKNEIQATPEIYDRSVFDRKDLKEKVEKLLDPLKVEDLIFKGKLTQEVPIYKSKDKKVMVTFATLEAGAESVIDKLAFEHCENTKEDVRKIGPMLELAASIVAIDGKPISNIEITYTPDKTEEYIKNVKEKFDHIRQMPSTIVLLLSTQLMWFIERVNNLAIKQFSEQIINF
jgi:hypothetical protein